MFTFRTQPVQLYLTTSKATKYTQETRFMELRIEVANELLEMKFKSGQINSQLEFNQGQIWYRSDHYVRPIYYISPQIYEVFPFFVALV